MASYGIYLYYKDILMENNQLHYTQERRIWNANSFK